MGTSEKKIQAVKNGLFIAIQPITEFMVLLPVPTRGVYLIQLFSKVHLQ